MQNQHIYSLFCALITKLSLNNLFEKQINLGDTFDRGEGPDKLIKIYRYYLSTEQSPFYYIWGNHDILWMGAALGNPVLVATAVRISLRYQNVDFLHRYGFDLEKLKKLALKTYHHLPTGKYLSEQENGAFTAEEAVRMAKILQIIESKLTYSYLRELQQDDLYGDLYKEMFYQYQQVFKLLPSGLPADPAIWESYRKEHPLYLDVYFPTIKAENPGELTSEEQEIIDDLTRQFISLENFRQDLLWFFQKGQIYQVIDQTLYYHAAIPATINGELETLWGLQGRALLDFIQSEIKRLGEKLQERSPVALEEKMFFWYLWCGPLSPFFCKNKMATMERAIFDKEEAKKGTVTTHSETPNPYYQYIRQDKFVFKILDEFHAERLCMGHTPVKSIAQAILGEKGRAFIVDGGASSAFGDQGAVLIATPDYTYLTIHPGLQELQKAQAENRLPDIEVRPLEERRKMRVENLDEGVLLKEELKVIDELLESKLAPFCQNYFAI